MLDNIRKALVVAAHPDDEVLGCGATVAQMVRAGIEVRTLILATGALSRPDTTASDVERLKHRARAAAKILGTADPQFAGFPDNAMDTVPLIDIVRKVEQIGASFRPDLILTHHQGDLNIDHQICFKAVLTAFRFLPGTPQSAILSFETPSATEYGALPTTAFVANHYVEIGDGLETKLQALRAYDEEMRPSPHPRSIDHIRDLARVRGREVGVGACEAFVLIRSLHKFIES